MPPRPSPFRNPYGVQEDGRPSAVRGLAWGAGVAAVVSVAGLAGVAHADTGEGSGSWDTGSTGSDTGYGTYSSDTSSPDTFSADTSFSSSGTFSPDTSFSSGTSSEPVTLPDVEEVSTPVVLPDVELDRPVVPLPDGSGTSDDVEAVLPDAAVTPVVLPETGGTTVVEPVRLPVGSTAEEDGEPFPVSSDVLEAAGVASADAGDGPTAEVVLDAPTPESPGPVVAGGAWTTVRADTTPVELPDPTDTPQDPTGGGAAVVVLPTGNGDEDVTEQEPPSGTVVVDGPTGAPWSSEDGNAVVPPTTTDDPPDGTGDVSTSPALLVSSDAGTADVPTLLGDAWTSADGTELTPGRPYGGVLLAPYATSDVGGSFPLNTAPLPVAPDNGPLFTGQQPVQVAGYTPPSTPSAPRCTYVYGVGPSGRGCPVPRPVVRPAPRVVPAAETYGPPLPVRPYRPVPMPGTRYVPPPPSRSDSGVPADGVLVASAAVSDSGGILPVAAVADGSDTSRLPASTTVLAQVSDRPGQVQPGDDFDGRALERDWFNALNDAMVVGPGNSGPYVRALQNGLNRLNGCCSDAQRVVDVDGHYGTATERAVRNFQRTHGLPEDGIIGPATQRRMHEILESQGVFRGRF